jgi:3,4-dihydroxy-9,10-secoandrosta-1,3,5(10)-triene-9,17-dione 4,5-dioxygenase
VSIAEEILIVTWIEVIDRARVRRHHGYQRGVTVGHIQALGYFGVGVRDLDAWKDYAGDVLGMHVTESREDGQPVLYLRIDARQHRIAVRPGEDSVNYVGWQLASVADLDALCTDLRAADITHAEDADLAAARGVHRLVTCIDPAGINLEFFVGATVPKTEFVSPTGAEFVTTDGAGADLGLGHVVFGCENPSETMAFYIDVLGFKISDYIVPVPGFLITFLHCNARHHSFAVAGLPPGFGTRLDHFMVEVSDIDTVGRALDKIAAADIKTQATLGRHTNDEMLSFYAATPSGFGVEYGTGGRLIDEQSWTVVTYDSAEYWGHHRHHATDYVPTSAD